ncbi:MAG TPA: periplasmic heavy metal sensor [Pyrinomonadaceae bacterium]
MCKFPFGVSALLALFLSAGAAAVRAQDENAPDATPEVQRELDARRRGANAAGLLRVLNLTPEQRARIGAIRRETEPQNRLLGARLRQARRELDEAIYAADPDEGVIENRVRELGEAQSAVVRLRSLTELRIRRVLSPEQLDAFRRLQSQTRTRRRREDQPQQPPGDSQGDAPARFGDRKRRRDQERRQQRRLLDERNEPPAPREPRLAPSRDRRP